eukprot:600353-Karenia_brevis.AAC.1
MVDTSIHEHVELLYVLAAESHIRAHGGITYLHRDGSWSKYNGIPSEGLLEQTRSMMLVLEGLYRLVAQTQPLPGNDAAILQA